MNMREKCRQTAVYWAAPVSDGRGSWTFTAPAEITVRWDNTAVEYKDTQGEIKVSKAVVLLKSGTVVVGGYLYLGALASITGTNTDPTAVAGAYPIMSVPSVPVISNRQTIVKAIL